RAEPVENRAFRVAPWLAATSASKCAHRARDDRTAARRCAPRDRAPRCAEAEEGCHFPYRDSRAGRSRSLAASIAEPPPTRVGDPARRRCKCVPARQRLRRDAALPGAATDRRSASRTAWVWRYPLPWSSACAIGSLHLLRAPMPRCGLECSLFGSLFEVPT